MQFERKRVSIFRIFRFIWKFIWEESDCVSCGI